MVCLYLYRYRYRYISYMYVNNMYAKLYWGGETLRSCCLLSSSRLPSQNNSNNNNNKKLAVGENGMVCGAVYLWMAYCEIAHYKISYAFTIHKAKVKAKAHREQYTWPPAPPPPPPHGGVRYPMYGQLESRHPG